jgi:NAD(P)-dependent dehydrogenase (short-subunit alcohol dehydrogenase family)
MAARLFGKTAIVTGGGGGIGRAAALALAAEGAYLVINDVGRDAQGQRLADAAVDEIQRAGGRAVASYASVTTLPGGSEIVASAVEAFGGVDILVACAGNYKERMLVEMTEDDWDSQIDVNLKGTFTCIRAAVPEMIKRQGGRIITVASRAAFGNPRGGLAYAAAKAGVMGATAQMARELKSHAIAVNCLLPSANTTLFPKTEQRAGSPLPEAGSLDPACIAPVIVYLCTDAASGVTGQFIYSSGSDVMVHHYPLDMQTLLHKQGRWTAEELAAAIPPLLAFKG